MDLCSSLRGHAGQRSEGCCSGAPGVLSPAHSPGMVAVSLPHGRGWEGTIGSRDTKRFQEDRQRILNKFRCHFTVIFSFHNCAGEKMSDVQGPCCLGEC